MIAVTEVFMMGCLCDFVRGWSAGLFCEREWFICHWYSLHSEKTALRPPKKVEAAERNLAVFFSPPVLSPASPRPRPCLPQTPPPPDPLLPQTERRQENKHMKGIQSIATAEKKNPIKTERSITSVQLLMFKSLRHWDLSFNCTHTGYCRFRI